MSGERERAEAVIANSERPDEARLRGVYVTASPQAVSLARDVVALAERVEQAEKNLNEAVGWLLALGWVKHEETWIRKLAPKRMSDGRIR
jgi:hypothetical protein